MGQNQDPYKNDRWENLIDAFRLVPLVGPIGGALAGSAYEHIQSRKSENAMTDPIYRHAHSGMASVTSSTPSTSRPESKKTRLTLFSPKNALDSTIEISELLLGGLALLFGLALYLLLIKSIFDLIFGEFHFGFFIAPSFLIPFLIFLGLLILLALWLMMLHIVQELMDPKFLCLNCGWIGCQSELGESYKYGLCPDCGSGEELMWVPNRPYLEEGILAQSKKIKEGKKKEEEEQSELLRLREVEEKNEEELQSLKKKLRKLGRQAKKARAKRKPPSKSRR
jgi:hypothetical protein